ncbi:ankyrin repeat-containing domain protein [Trichoderma asperelloides]|nr:ankyrin repeat-containing domain protein [Trichoderma asperelloides]
MSSSDNAETNKVEPTSVLELRVRFPTGKFTQRVFEVPKELRGRFPTEQFSALEISLHDGAENWRIIVKEELHRFERLWNESLVPAPFTFPYGDKHWFDLARYESQLEEAVLQSSQFPMSLNFPDLPSMQAVVLSANYAPLHWAILQENDRVTKLLLENGACVDAYGYMSQTPLWLAAWKGSESIVQLLLEGGADIEAKDSEGQTPLSKAAE